MSTCLGRRLAAILALGLLMPGCYGKRLTTLESRTARIEDQVNQLSRMHVELSNTVTTLNRLLEEEVKLARSGRAGNEERLREIQRLLNAVATRLDESHEQVSELRDTVRYQRPARVDSAGGGTTVTPRTLYDAAYQDLTRGNHGLALLGFQEMLAKYPDSELADNAQYWIGETYYAQKDFPAALREFEKAVATYPKGDKIPAALLKAGFCQVETGDKAGARDTFRKLQERYPQSEEARLSATKLQDLD
jgi:tol-pal system protein YbgF